MLQRIARYQQCALFLSSYFRKTGAISGWVGGKAGNYQKYYLMRWISQLHATYWVHSSEIGSSLFPCGMGAHTNGRKPSVRSSYEKWKILSNCFPRWNSGALAGAWDFNKDSISLSSCEEAWLKEGRRTYDGFELISKTKRMEAESLGGNDHIRIQIKLFSSR